MSQMISLRRQLLAASAVALISLVGCVVTPARPRYATDLVTVEPPPPQVEVVGVAPAPGYIWIGGYWGWVGGRHEWIRGRWEAPRPGYAWEPHVWVREGVGWRLREGRWVAR